MVLFKFSGHWRNSVASTTVRHSFLLFSYSLLCFNRSISSYTVPYWGSCVITSQGHTSLCVAPVTVLQLTLLCLNLVRKIGFCFCFLFLLFISKILSLILIESILNLFPCMHLKMPFLFLFTWTLNLFYYLLCVMWFQASGLSALLRLLKHSSWSPLSPSAWMIFIMLCRCLLFHHRVVRCLYSLIYCVVCNIAGT